MINEISWFAYSPAPNWPLEYPFEQSTNNWLHAPICKCLEFVCYCLTLMLMSSLAISILVVSMSKEIAAWHWREIHPGIKWEDGWAEWKHGTTGANGEWVEFLGGRVEKESVCGLKKTFGKINGGIGSLEPLDSVIWHTEGVWWDKRRRLNFPTAEPFKHLFKTTCPASFSFVAT